MQNKDCNFIKAKKNGPDRDRLFLRRNYFRNAI